MGGFHGMFVLFAKHTKISCLMVNTLRTAIRRTIPINQFGSTVERHHISVKVLSRLHAFDPKVLQIYSLDMHHTRVAFGNGDIRVGHIEEFEQMDASESMLKDPMQKKCVGVQKMVIMCFRSQLEESNYLEEIRF